MRWYTAKLVRLLRRWLRICAVLIPTVWAAAAVAQIYSLADLNTEQIRQLDRARTAVIIPGGIMEEHGPYLPSFTDGIADQHLLRNLPGQLSPAKAGR